MDRILLTTEPQGIDRDEVMRVHNARKKIGKSLNLLVVTTGTCVPTPSWRVGGQSWQRVIAGSLHWFKIDYIRTLFFLIKIINMFNRN